MPSRNDRRAALVLLCVAVVGAGVRWVALGPEAPGAIGYAPAGTERPTLDSVEARAARLARPLGRDERINVDLAAAEELIRLPRIGPALATRIVEDRTESGPFGSLDELGRVSGIGPSTLRTIERHVEFSGRATRTQAVQSETLDLNRANARELARLPGVGPTRAAAIVEDRDRNGHYLRVDDLTRVPGIGPKTVERVRPYVRVS